MVAIAVVIGVVTIALIVVVFIILVVMIAVILKKKMTVWDGTARKLILQTPRAMTSSSRKAEKNWEDVTTII